MFFVSTQLSLPLFLLTRTRYKHHRPQAVRKYITKRRRYYEKYCNEGNENPTVEHKRLRHLAGFREPASKDLCRRSERIFDTKRELIQFRRWELPPNLYRAKSNPFFERKGIFGALWQKVHKTKSIKKKVKSKWTFYNIQQDSECLLHPSNRHKGIFLSNARERMPTARCMILDTSAPNYAKRRSSLHYPKRHTLEYNIPPEDRKELMQPHSFYPHSCVPVRDFPSAIHKPNISFAPGPGRYDIRFPKTCACPRKIYAPDIHYDIEREKRQKFRRLPYKTINAHRYCTPKWRHVQGQGHKWLFRTTGKPVAKTEARSSLKYSKTLQLYHPAYYINQITNPTRLSISLWPDGYQVPPPKVRFNCMAKRTVRKQLRVNRKIAFHSGRERFPGLEKRPSLTHSQIEAIKMTLPVDRRACDHPIMNVDSSTIQSKLMVKPRHQLPSLNLNLRKRLFKFPPLPMPKILVADCDIHSTSTDGKYEPQLYYGKELSVLDYIKNDVIRAAYVKSGGIKRQSGQKKEIAFVT